MDGSFKRSIKEYLQTEKNLENNGAGGLGEKKNCC